MREELEEAPWATRSGNGDGGARGWRLENGSLVGRFLGVGLEIAQLRKRWNRRRHRREIRWIFSK